MTVRMVDIWRITNLIISLLTWKIGNSKFRQFLQQGTFSFTFRLKRSLNTNVDMLFNEQLICYLLY